MFENPAAAWAVQRNNIGSRSRHTSTSNRSCALLSDIPAAEGCSGRQYRHGGDLTPHRTHTPPATGLRYQIARRPGLCRCAAAASETHSSNTFRWPAAWWAPLMHGGLTWRNSCRYRACICCSASKGAAAGCRADLDRVQFHGKTQYDDIHQHAHDNIRQDRHSMQGAGVLARRAAIARRTGRSSTAATKPLCGASFNPYRPPISSSTGRDI